MPDADGGSPEQQGGGLEAEADAVEGALVAADAIVDAAPIAADLGAGEAQPLAADAVPGLGAVPDVAPAGLNAAAVAAPGEDALQARNDQLQQHVDALKQEIQDGVVAAAAEAARLDNVAAAALIREPGMPKVDSALQLLFDSYDDVWQEDLQAMLPALAAHAGVTVLNIKTMDDAGGSRADVSAPLLKDYTGTPQANGAAVDFVGELAETSVLLRERLQSADVMHRTVRIVRSLHEAAVYARLQLPTASVGVAPEPAAGSAGEEELSSSVFETKSRALKLTYQDDVKLHRLVRSPQLFYLDKHFKNKCSFPTNHPKLRLGLLHAYEELLGSGVSLVEESTLHMDAKGAVVCTGFGPKEAVIKSSFELASRFDRLVYSVFFVAVDKTVDAALYDVGTGFKIAGVGEMLAHKTPLLGLSELFLAAAPQLSLEVMNTAIQDCHRGLIENTTGEGAMTISRAAVVALVSVRSNLNYPCQIAVLGRGGSNTGQVPSPPLHLYTDASLSGQGASAAAEVHSLGDTAYAWVVAERNPADECTPWSARRFLPEMTRPSQLPPSGRWR